VLLWNGFPDRAQMAPEWRQVASRVSHKKEA
jgi:hypothetical protein